MSKLFTGSICLTDLIEAAKKNHSAFVKSTTNNKIYINVLLWENDKPDQYDNTHSLQLNSKKELREQEGKIYAGNFKPIEKKEPQPLTKQDAQAISEIVDDLPF